MPPLKVLKTVLCMILDLSTATQLYATWQDNPRIAMELLAPSERKSREGIYGYGDKVLKATGDYHIEGFVVAAFYTYWWRKLRYVVEHRAEGGGSFCHIYAHDNLKLLKKANAHGSVS